MIVLMYIFGIRPATVRLSNMSVLYTRSTCGLKLI